MAKVELRGVGKVFPGAVAALAGIDLDVAAGEFLAVVGPSGSGKSTLLRLVAGLEAPSSGTIRLDGRPAAGLAPRDRGVAMVFQDPAPYPHLTVFDNLAFGLRARGRPSSEVRALVAETAALLGLAGDLGRRPASLSGGQRQRVALGRALARRPGLLLLDEPLSNLDAPLRASIRAELIDLHRRLGIATILVTHDQAEALAMGGRVAVLIGGRLAQVGTPSEVYDRPASRPVAAFIGSPPMAFLPCAVVPHDGRLVVRMPDAPLEGTATALDAAPWGGPLRQAGPGEYSLGLRAEHVRPATPEDDAREAPIVAASVRRLEPTGHETVVTLDLGPHPLRMRLPTAQAPGLGATLLARLDLSRAAWFDAAGQRLG